MIFRTTLSLVIISCCSLLKVHAQGDFCDAVTTIIRDAPDQFRDIRGKVIKARAEAVFWESGIKVPGAISSRFVSSNGLFYEGALFQTKNKDEVKAAYDKYSGQLKSCFSQGYKEYHQDNFYPGMEDYKKVVFMPVTKTDTRPGLPPPHITMEATFNKTVGFYTIVMYIFEH